MHYWFEAGIRKEKDQVLKATNRYTVHNNVNNDANI